MPLLFVISRYSNWHIVTRNELGSQIGEVSIYMDWIHIADIEYHGISLIGGMSESHGYRGILLSGERVYTLLRSHLERYHATWTGIYTRREGHIHVYRCFYH